MNRNALSLAATLLAALLSLPLCTSAPLPGGAVARRSSLDGYDVPGVGAGLDARELAARLATQRGRVGAALALAGRHLRTVYRMGGSFAVEYRPCPDHGAEAIVTLRLDGPGGDVSPREEEEACRVVVDYLREAGMGAGGAGRLCVRAVG